MLAIIFVVEVASEVAEMLSVSEPNSLRVVFEAFKMMFCGVEPPEPPPETPHLAHHRYQLEESLHHKQSFPLPEFGRNPTASRPERTR